MSQLNHTEGWSEFVEIVEAGSISEAARRLNIPRASLSRRLSALEDRLQVRLLQRSTQHMALTQAGELLYANAQRVLQEAQSIIDDLHQDTTLSGRLRVSMPPSLGTMSDLILSFITTYPDIELELHQSPRHVDLVAERFDVALRAGQVKDDALIARRLTRNHLIAVAHVDYLESFGMPQHLDDLLKHRCLVGFGGGLTPIHHWPLQQGSTTPVRAAFACSDIHVLAEAVYKGHGIGMVPMPLVQRGIQDGRLRQVLPDQLGMETFIHLVYPVRDYLPMRTRAFIDHTIAWIGDKKLDDMILKPPCR